MPAHGLLAPNPSCCSISGTTTSINLDRAKVHVPHILVDRLVWAMVSSLGKCKDRKMPALEEVLYVAPLICAKNFLANVLQSFSWR